MLQQTEVDPAAHEVQALHREAHATPERARNAAIDTACTR
jgi:hypothetical protein